jgi:hypoxanthine phosphoribosyltransferase
VSDIMRAMVAPEPTIGEVLLSQDQIRSRLSELAADRVEIDWITVSSYGSGTSSSGVIRMVTEPSLDLAGRNVLVVDDITDSGLTLSWLVENLRSQAAASVEVLSLLRKPDMVKMPVPLRYLGFDIPPEFVAGYGMDYAQRFRNLPYIATLTF